MAPPRKNSTRPGKTAQNGDIGGEAAVRAAFARQGFMRRLGAWLEAVEPGRVVVEIPYSDRVAGRAGAFHNGVASALADCAAGSAILSKLPEGSTLVTVEYKINFMKPLSGDRLRAEARVLRQGRSLSVAQADISVIQKGNAELSGLVQATYLRVGNDTGSKS